MFLHFNKDLVKTSFVDLFEGRDCFLQVFDRAFDFTLYKFRGIVPFHCDRHLWENLFSLQQALLFSSRGTDIDYYTKGRTIFARTLTIAILFRNSVYLTSYNEQNQSTTIYPGNVDASTQCALSTLRQFDYYNSMGIDIELLTQCLSQKIEYTGTIDQALFQFFYDLSYKTYGVPLMPKYDDKYCYQGIVSQINLELELYLQTFKPEDVLKYLEAYNLDDLTSENLYDRSVDNYYRYLLNDALFFLRNNLCNSYLIEFLDTCKLLSLYEAQIYRITTSAIKSIDTFSAPQKKAFITKVKNIHLLNYQMSK
jgi:hypothetical protein